MNTNDKITLRHDEDVLRAQLRYHEDKLGECVRQANWHREQLEALHALTTLGRSK